MDRPQVGERAVGGSASIWKNYAILIYTAIAFAAVLIAAGAIADQHNIRWDLTPGRQYSLSQFDQRVLAGLTHNVKVMAFVRVEDPTYLDLSNLLFQASAFTPRLTYQVIDVNRAPGLSREYGVSTYGEVVVESQGRRRDFDNSRSDELIPAILQVSTPANKHVYFTIGHGERDLFSSDRNLGYSEWRTLLLQNNYQIDNVSLFAGGVPANASVLVALGPRSDFLPQELAALQTYLSHGGHFLAMIDPYGSPALVKFLKQYDLDFSGKVIVDPAYRLTAGEILTTQIPIRSKNNDISRAMAEPAVFSLARAVMPLAVPGAAAPGGLVLWRASAFLKSSRESWASGDPKALTTGITAFQTGRDIRGPVPVGTEMDFTPAATPHIPLDRMTRIVGFGSSAFASNQFIEMLGNRSLATSAINALAGDEMMIASRERINRAETAAFYVTDEQTRNLAIFGAFAEPLLLFMIGSAVFVRRRFFA
ncbi:MAG: Gldg family protein [Candidatus Binataceae bacterium]